MRLSFVCAYLCYVRTFVSICLRVCPCVGVRESICMHACVWVCICACASVRLYVCEYGSVHTHACGYDVCGGAELRGSALLDGLQLMHTHTAQRLFRENHRRPTRSKDTTPPPPHLCTSTVTCREDVRQACFETFSMLADWSV